MWLAIAPTDLLAISAVITAVGGVSLPFLLPLATKKTKVLDAKIEDLQRRVDECEEREKQHYGRRSRSRSPDSR